MTFQSYQVYTNDILFEMKYFVEYIPRALDAQKSGFKSFELRTGNNFVWFVMN